MPEPKEEEEQYGPPLPPQATRQWRMPEGSERADRGAKNVVEYMFGPGYSLRGLLLDGEQLLTDIADPTVRKKFAETAQWHGGYGQGDNSDESATLGELIDDAEWYDPLAHPEWHDAGNNPLERFGDWVTRRGYQRDTVRDVAEQKRLREQPARQGKTVEAPIDWNGSVGVTR